MNTQDKNRPPRHSRIVELLGSMNLAITILVVVAIASVIGTVLQQNQSYDAYQHKFGPFWFEVFKFLGLYDVYGAVWFLILLAFLLISTSVCVYRNTPHILRDMRDFRLGVQLKSLALMKNHAEWNTDSSVAEASQQLEKIISRQGYRLRRKQSDEVLLLAGIRGAWNRPGYVLTHVGIIVLCIGGLIDGNFGLAIKEWTGKIQVAAWNATGDKQDIPSTARLSSSDTLSFRGAMSIPEGGRQGFVVLNVRDGFLVQDLPFEIELKDFRIEHYESGQPKSFESDLVIHDRLLEKPLEKTIAVNHPLVYRGYAIYQSNFGDGGSRLDFKAWPLFASSVQSEAMSMLVNSQHTLKTPMGVRSMELDEFKVYNIMPNDEALVAAGGRKFRNYGPSFQFKLRDERGVAREYFNYMLPIEQEGRLFFLSGVRNQPNEMFQYLHIPADRNASIERFMKFHALLHDEKRMQQIATQNVETAIKSQAISSTAGFKEEVVASMMKLVGLFNQNGYLAIEADIKDKVPQEKQKQVADAYLKVLFNVLQSAYYELLAGEGVNINQELSMEDSRFYDDAVIAMSNLGVYGSPMFMQLENFQHRESSGLQITRKPGEAIVYLGCFMLIAGIFMMFYISYRRLWVMLVPQDAGTRVVVAGMGNRDLRDFAEKFVILTEQMQRVSARDRVV